MRSQLALNLLRQSGWSEDRQPEVAPFVATLEACGFEVNPRAREFLSQYGGLRVAFVRANGGEDSFWTTVDEPHNVTRDGERRVEEAMGESVCYCGGCRTSPVLLFVGDSGRCAVTVLDELSEYESVDDALETILMG